MPGYAMTVKSYRGKINVPQELQRQQDNSSLGDTSRI